MATISRDKETHRKRGSKRNEEAVKHRKEVTNFKQSKDIHEDRSTLQSKLSGVKKGGPVGHRSF